MHLDDIENESAPHVEQYLNQIRVIRQITQKTIAFLAQIEDFQKKLWLKEHDAGSVAVRMLSWY